MGSKGRHVRGQQSNEGRKGRSWSNSESVSSNFVKMSTYALKIERNVGGSIRNLTVQLYFSVVTVETAPISGSSGDFSHGPQHVFWTCSYQMDKSRDMSLKKIPIFWTG